MDGIIKSILFFAGLIVSIVWLSNNPYSWRKRIQFLKNPHTIIATVFETLVIYQLFGPPIFPLPRSIFTIPFQLLGLIIFIGATVFAIWARFTMGKSWGMPAQHDIAIQKKLITSGPFCFTRNPIYVSLLLMFIGFELGLGSLLVVLVIPLYIIMYRSIIVEEKLLEKHFGNTYLHYKTRVPRFLFI